MDALGLVGQALHGQFRVDEVVTDDGRSVLYRGHHLMLDVPIALKCMKPPRDAEMAEGMIRRFRHESRLHYKLAQGNPNIVRVLASGTVAGIVTAGLCPFMVREWHEGRSLAEDLAERRARANGGRDLREAVRLLSPAVDALVYVHACGVVHRAVTPEHLFVAKQRDGTERVLILDFGVAKVVSDHALDLAPASQSMGFASLDAPAYAAPEQLNTGIGIPGPWTDIYSLAIVLLEALRGGPVFEAAGPPLPLRVIDPAKRPSPRALGITLPGNVDALLQSAVQVDPKSRPADIAEFWREIRETVGEGTLAPSTRRAPDTDRLDGPATLAQTPRMASGAEQSPLAHSVDAADSVPPPSVDDRTQVMRPSDVLASLEREDSEPLPTKAELFVTHPAAATLAHPAGRLRTMVSPGQEEIAEAMRAPHTVADPPVVEPDAGGQRETAKMLAAPAAKPVVPTQPMAMALPGAFSSEPLGVVPPPAAPVATVVAARSAVLGPAAAPPIAPVTFAPPVVAPPSPAPRRPVAQAPASTGPSVRALVLLIVILLAILGATTAVLIRLI